MSVTIPSEERCEQVHGKYTGGSKDNAKPLRLHLETLQLRPFLRGFIEDHQTVATAKRQEIRLAEGPCNGQMVGDTDRMRQILTNLTQNACDAAPEGAIVCWRIFDDEATGTIALELHNPGPAIPAELLGRIMKPFVSTKPTGTGLGLAIVKRLVEIQGGDIALHSTEGDGTRATLRFPRATTSSP